MTGPGRSKPGARSARPAARRPARSTTRSAAPAPAPVAGWRGRIQRAGSDQRSRRLLFLGGAFLLLAIIVGPTLKAYIGQQRSISQLRSEVAAQEKAVADLKAEQAKWQDPAYVEQQARKRLKFVKVGEKAYTVLDPQDSPAVAPGMASAPRDAAWYSTVWASVEAADAPAAAQ